MLFLISGYSQNTYGQPGKTISGNVTDQNGTALAGASVYLSQTSKGVTSSASGEFRLENMPQGKYDLVVSAIGYETKIIPLSSEKYPITLKILLSRQAAELAEVVVQPRDENGWRKYGKYFIDNFIGTTRNAKYCKITNREVINFRFSEKSNRLTVKPDEPIIIENKFLGYRITFQLIEFTADFNTDVVAYYGYPLYTELNDGGGKIFNNRRKAYYGSLMHFIRTVYEDNFKDEGFKVTTIVARPNDEKERVKKILQDSIQMRHSISALSFGTVQATSSNENAVHHDSLRYYKKIIKQQDTLTHTVLLGSLSEMISGVSAYSKSLFFKNPIQVVYNNKRSEIALKTPVALEIFRNGSYFSPTELIIFKYWSEQEKICNMLPLDYYP